MGKGKGKLYYFCNFLWLLNYFKIKSFKIKKFTYDCEIWGQKFKQLSWSIGTRGWKAILRDILYLTSASLGHGCFILSLQNQLFFFFHFYLYVTESGKIAIPKFQNPLHLWVQGKTGISWSQLQILRKGWAQPKSSTYSWYKQLLPENGITQYQQGAFSWERRRVWD